MPLFWIWKRFLKMGQSRPFPFFGLFKHQWTFEHQIFAENDPSGMRHGDSNSLPLERVSPPIRPEPPLSDGFCSLQVFVFIIARGLYMNT